MIISSCYDFLVQLVRPRLWDCSMVALHYQWINLEHFRPGVQMKGTTYLYYICNKTFQLFILSLDYGNPNYVCDKMYFFPCSSYAIGQFRYFKIQL